MSWRSRRPFRPRRPATAGSARRHPDSPSRRAPKRSLGVATGPRPSNPRSTDKESKNENRTPTPASRHKRNRARRIDAENLGARTTTRCRWSHGDARLWESMPRFLDMMSAYRPSVTGTRIRASSRTGRAGTAAGGDLARLPQRRCRFLSGGRSGRLARTLANGEPNPSRPLKAGIAVSTSRGQAVCAGLSRPLDHHRRVLVEDNRDGWAVRARYDPFADPAALEGGDHAEYGGFPGQPAGRRWMTAAGRLSMRRICRKHRADDLR